MMEMMTWVTAASVSGACLGEGLDEGGKPLDASSGGLG